jgi:hypothetical protein
MGLLEEIVNQPVEALVVALVAAVFIIVLSAVGTAVAGLPGGQQAQGMTNLGITAIVLIAGAAGIAGFIKLIQALSEAAEGIGNGL